MITRRHSKLGAGLAAAVTAAGCAAVLGGHGEEAKRGNEAHLLATSQKSASFFPKHRHAIPGDQLGFGDKVAGDDTGTTRAVCTILDGGTGLPCTVWVKLSKGTLALQGMLPEKARNAPIAVTGGTGAYNGARGTAYATDLSSSKTRIVVDLLP
jgi:hypothetical protein